MGEWQPPTMYADAVAVSPPPAPMAGRRVAAGFIDLVPVCFVALALSNRDSGGDGFSANLSGGNALLALVIVLGYSFVAEVLTGTTPGKWLLGLTVVDADERRPGVGSVAVRTAFRLVDALPVFYLVGFVVMLATPGKQRVGDLVARTQVVHREDVRATNGAPSPTRSALVVATIAAVTLAIGAVSWAATSGDDDHDRVGSFDYEEDVVPLVDRTIDDVFREPAPQDLLALFASGTATQADVEELIDQIREQVGALQSEPRIAAHQVLPSQRLVGLDGVDGPVDVVQVRVEATFEHGPGEVLITLADIDGDLRVLRWDVSLT